MSDQDGSPHGHLTALRAFFAIVAFANVLILAGGVLLLAEGKQGIRSVITASVILAVLLMVTVQLKRSGKL